ncbi:PAS domain S-box protein [Kordiimonas sp.]|uniref:PAS domain-containing sensor histidine kinase n=1 Tax=Kordiimonas sp. TaxID=1970157 RepID=UPI003A94EC23
MLATDQLSNTLLDGSAYQHDLLFAIADNAADGIVVADECGKILLANKAACVMFGYFPTELVGKDIKTVLPAGFGAEAQGAIRRYSSVSMRQATSGSLVEHSGLARDGQEVPLELSIGAVTMEEGRTIYIANMRDITERKLAMDKVRRQAQIIDQIKDGILVTGIDRRVRKCNALLCEILEMPKADVIGKDIYELVEYDLGGDLTREDLRAEVVEHGVWNGQIRIVNAAGNARWLDVSVTPQRTDGHEIDGFISVWRDITSRYEEEVAAARCERIESLGRVAGGVAHDINNLLFPLFLSLDSALEDLKSVEKTEFLEELEENVSDALSVGMNIKEVVQNIMVFSHDSSTEVTECDTDALFKEMWRIAKLCVPSSVNVRTDFTSESGRICLSGTALSQVVVNLVSNAVDAVDAAKGEITVSTRIVRGQDIAKPRLFDIRPERYVALYVEDNGTGIDEFLLDKIFEPFFTTKGVGEGSGIGMSQVSQIVQGLDGAIDVESEVGKGTRFSVYLPLI